MAGSRTRNGLMQGLGRSAVVLTLLLSACAGSDSSLPLNPDSGTDLGRNQYEQRCAPDNDLARNASGVLLSGYGSGSRAIEKQWIRAFMEDLYLWYREIPSVDPNASKYNTGSHFDLMEAYFNDLRSPVLTASSKPRDRFSFAYPTEDWKRLSESGIAVGYGVEWKLVSSTVPRVARAAFVNPDTPASRAGVSRGDSVVSVTINGTRVPIDATSQSDIALLNEALFPSRANQTVSIELRSNAGNTRSVSLTSAEVTSKPVLLTSVLSASGTDPTRIGYMVFNDFITPAEGQLIAAIKDFKSRGVSELVLDLRYNGGGYLYIASQLAYMIAGPTRTGDKDFERYVYNDKVSRQLNASENRLPFYSTTSNYSGSGTSGSQSLPTLNLQRLIVLTSSGTCSASESVINGLRGISVPVLLVGSPTCGKPYGFYGKDNCGITYFPIEFQGVNAAGFGDYADGFPANCAASDDLGHNLGDPNEGMLAAALSYRVNNVCPTPRTAAAKSDGSPLDEGRLIRVPAREGKFLRPPAP